MYHLWFLICRRGSSSTTPSPTSPSSLSQDSVFDVNQIHRKSSTRNKVKVRVESFGETRCTKSTETENKIKIGNPKRIYKAIYRMNCLIGFRNSERIWLMKVLQQSLGVTQSKEVKTLPGHLMNFKWKSRAKVEKGSGKHSEDTHFPPKLRYLLEDENIKGIL